MNEASGSHPSLADLSAFDAGRLSPDERTIIERHLAECDECGRRRNALSRASAVSTPADPERPNRDAPTRIALGAEVPAALADHPRYHILEMLGEGGMGIVYKARHRLMDRVVALKVPNRRLLDRPGFTERFYREARAAARLVHPNIVLAHDAEQAGDLPFLVMEYVPGTSLDRIIAQRGPLPVNEACDCVRQAALGLQHAHEHGMIHRDIKPANLLQTPAGQIKVLDFGLAQLARQENDYELTETPPGVMLGTPDYSAPEQSRDARTADARADVYSLGCTLYFLLTGQPPFPGGTMVEKILAHQDRTPPSVARFRDDVPISLTGIVARMLAKAPADRPQSAAAVARLLVPFAGVADSHTPVEEIPVAHVVRERPRWLVPLLATAILLMVGAVGTAGLLVVLHWKQRTPSTSAAVEKPADPLLLAMPEQVAALKKKRREQTITWLRANAVRPDAQVVQDIARKSDEDLDQHDSFQLLLGSNLVRSGQAVLLAAQPGGFFVFPLTEEQAKGMGIKDNVCGWHPSPHAVEPRRAAPRVRLSKLSLSPLDTWKANAEIVGSIAYQVDGPTIQPPFAVRIRFYHEKRYTLLMWFQDKELVGQGKLALRYPLHTGRAERDEPVAVFADVASKQEDGLVVESDTAAVLTEIVSRPP
ncbi:MAG TPA: protein kinase [Gemmataceae bacterium]|jgi:serine/threonine protein kinase